MKSQIVFIAAVCLLFVFPFNLQTSRADMAPPSWGPNPSMQEPATTDTSVKVPVYSVAAGVVGVALTGSLVALRAIRKRNEN